MKPLCKLIAAAVVVGNLFQGVWGSDPSRKPEAGCAWEKLSSAALGLEAWVQRCRFGDRRIDFFVSGQSIVQRYSDGGTPTPVVDVLALLPNETPASGIKRFFSEHTDKTLASKCVLATAPTDAVRPRAGVKRYTFVPNRAYAKRLRAAADPNEVPPPPCGDWGDQPDGVQYFEVPAISARARKVLFVRYGQDEPLFDEETLALLPRP